MPSTRAAHNGVNALPTDGRLDETNAYWRGYKQHGSINTPLELAIQIEIDRFSLAIDVINRGPRLRVAGAHVKEKLRDKQIDCCHDAHVHGVDDPEVAGWTWPYETDE